MNDLIENHQGGILTVDIADSNSTNSTIPKYRVTAADGEETYVSEDHKEVNIDGSEIKQTKYKDDDWSTAEL